MTSAHPLGDDEKTALFRRLPSALIDVPEVAHSRFVRLIRYCCRGVATEMARTHAWPHRNVTIRRCSTGFLVLFSAPFFLIDYVVFCGAAFIVHACCGRQSGHWSASL